LASSSSKRRHQTKSKQRGQGAAHHSRRPHGKPSSPFSLLRAKLVVDRGCGQLSAFASPLVCVNWGHKINSGLSSSAFIISPS
jgi:hypothetical protein